MQLDWYSYELALAFEYQGEQHYKYNRYFHRKKGDFEYQQQCDKLKRERCKKEKINLVEVKYSDEISIRHLAELIYKQCPSQFNKLVEGKHLKLTEIEISDIKKQ